MSIKEKTEKLKESLKKFEIHTFTKQYILFFCKYNKKFIVISKKGLKEKLEKENTEKIVKDIVEQLNAIKTKEIVDKKLKELRRQNIILDFRNVGAGTYKLLINNCCSKYFNIQQILNKDFNEKYIYKKIKEDRNFNFYKSFINYLKMYYKVKIKEKEIDVYINNNVLSKKEIIEKTEQIGVYNFVKQIVNKFKIKEKDKDEIKEDFEEQGIFF